LLAAMTFPRFYEWPSLCGRSLECAGLYRTVMGPFRAKFKMEKSAICGDLAAMVNRTDLCSWRPEVFETDEWGFRNSPEVFARSHGAGPVVVFGDSFAFGQGVTQDEIPSSQLERLIGTPVYNAAGKFELSHLRWVLDHLTTGWVVYFHLERHFHRAREAGEWDEVLEGRDFLKRARIFTDSLKNFNPLKVAAVRLEKKFLTPRVFPNRYDEGVPHGRLANGTEFLFLKSSVERFGDRRQGNEKDEGAYFEKLASLLGTRGIKLLVVLIPEKYSVYAPLLADPPAASSEVHYLTYLHRELTGRGVNAINLLPGLKDLARTGIAERKYYYWPDDSHWNAEGIAFAARAVSQALKAAH
jgi:hypothetical protein